MKKIIPLIAALSLACRGEHITMSTGLWHSELCHPDIYYKGDPPNASPECKWTQVYPPDAPYTVK